MERDGDYVERDGDYMARVATTHPCCRPTAHPCGRPVSLADGTHLHSWAPSLTPTLVGPFPLPSPSHQPPQLQPQPPPQGVPFPHPPSFGSCPAAHPRWRARTPPGYESCAPPHPPRQPPQMPPRQPHASVGARGSVCVCGGRGGNTLRQGLAVGIRLCDEALSCGPLLYTEPCGVAVGITPCDEGLPCGPLFAATTNSTLDFKSSSVALKKTLKQEDQGTMRGQGQVLTGIPSGRSNICYLELHADYTPNPFWGGTAEFNDGVAIGSQQTHMHRKGFHYKGDADPTARPSSGNPIFKQSLGLRSARSRVQLR